MFRLPSVHFWCLQLITSKWKSNRDAKENGCKMHSSNRVAAGGCISIIFSLLEPEHHISRGAPRGTSAPTMSESATFVNPVRQLPIWLFDLGRKSFFFGFPGQVRDIDSNQEDDSIPTVFALPRSAQPSRDNRHMSSTNITSTSQPKFTVQDRSRSQSQSQVGPAYCQQQLTVQKQPQDPARQALRKQYISLNTRTRVPVGPTHCPQPSFRKLSRIPVHHSSLSGYTSRYESWEHIAMGACTDRGEESMARKLTEWEIYWKKISGSCERDFSLCLWI
jgi:hypothetical protein